MENDKSSFTIEDLNKMFDDENVMHELFWIAQDVAEIGVGKLKDGTPAFVVVNNSDNPRDEQTFLLVGEHRVPVLIHHVPRSAKIP